LSDTKAVTVIQIETPSLGESDFNRWIPTRITLPPVAIIAHRDLSSPASQSIDCDRPAERVHH
jgi:hypothetical protein